MKLNKPFNLPECTIVQAGFHLVVVFVFLFLPFAYKAQSKEFKYKEVDSLTKSGSIINAMAAIRLLEGELVKDSTTSTYWINYSKAANNIYRTKDAKTAMQKAVSKNSKDANAHYEKARLHNMMNELPEALFCFNNAIDLKPEAEYYYWRGIVYQRQGENDKAMQDYDVAMSKSFEAPEMYNNYALLLGQKENYDKALLVINKAIALKPDYAEAYSARARIYFFTYRLDSACVDKNKALSLGYKKAFVIPDEICTASQIVKLQFASEMMMQGNMHKQAIIGFTWLIGLCPDSANYCLNRGFCYYSLKEFGKAEADYLKALELKCKDEKLLYSNLSLLYFDTDKYEKSVEACSKWIKLDPKDHIAYVERGLSYRKLKKYKESEADFNKSLTLKPDYFRAFGYRSFLYLEQGKYEKARDDAQKSVDLKPEYGYGYVVLGQAKQALDIDGYCIDFLQGKKFNGPDAEELLAKFCK